MSVIISQTPATASLAQSPIIFSVYSTGSVVSNSGFQYMADLYYWTGSVSDSGSVADYVFSKLWFCKMLIIAKFVFEQIILLLVLLIVLVVKQNIFFSKNVIKLLKIILCLLVSLPFLYFSKDYILLSFLHENFKGSLANLGLYSKAQNFFYPLFFALIIFMIIDVFQKGINLKQENDLTI
jgi:uncharacterized membrane protein YhdT